MIGIWVFVHRHKFLIQLPIPIDMDIVRWQVEYWMKMNIDMPMAANDMALDSRYLSFQYLSFATRKTIHFIRFISFACIRNSNPKYNSICWGTDVVIGLGGLTWTKGRRAGIKEMWKSLLNKGKNDKKIVCVCVCVLCMLKEVLGNWETRKLGTLMTWKINVMLRFRSKWN